MRHFVKLVRPYIVWAFIIIVVPILLIMLYSVTTGGNDLVNISFTWDNFKKIGEPIYLNVLKRSLVLGLISVAICFVFGYALAYFISKKSEKVQNLLILLVTIPMWINTLLRTYAWISMLSDNGLINTFLKWMGFKPLNLMYTDFAVILGLVTDLLPFMVIPIHTSIRKIDPSLIEASHDLGANKIQTFWKVTFKMSIPGVLNGIMMTFLLSISTFVIPKLLGGGQYMLIGNLIENQFISVGNWNFGSAISIILAFIILVGMTVMKKIDKEEKEEE
ncbi:ABC transporter permease [Eubacterium ruminantium]|uniref:ABC transporter permease n=1 Tax=Eubacterium ruminantium TaxID=42322 RepID=UPI001569A1D5|nr:ABC transporter permease [Eubacterium ruminantium]